MDKRTKQNILVTVIGVCLFTALMNFSVIWSAVGKVIGLILPVIVGGILALFINVPMTGIEKRIRKLSDKCKKPLSDKICRILSFVITLICILLVFSLVLTLLIPELIRSGKSLYYMVEARIPEWIEYLDAHNINAEWLENFLAQINLEQIMQNITSRLDTLLSGIVSTLSSVVNTVVTTAFGLIIAIYMVLSKERLHRHSAKLLYGYLPTSWANKISLFCRMFNQSFSNFLSGQCGEAVILGTLMFLAFSIFGLHYASLVGVITAFCAIIPYVGAFLSCVVSVFLTLIISPSQAVLCLIVYLVVQFIENQFIYPRVVGGSVGLPPLYTLIAAMIGGKLFGILGILFFIPLAAVLIELLKEGALNRNLRKNIDKPNCSK